MLCLPARPLSCSSKRLGSLAFKTQLRWSSYSHLHEELTARTFPLLYDRMSPGPSHMLETTLSDFLPPRKEWIKMIPDANVRDPPMPVKPGYHLIYFNPSSPLSQLLPDGTEPRQSPGEPFVRRMWAGGKVTFSVGSAARKLRLSTPRACCVERISDVQIKGREGEEKVFVTIERRISGSKGMPIAEGSRSYKFVDGLASHSETDVRSTLDQDENCSLIEHRNIVFMREQQKPDADAKPVAPKIIKAPHPPTFSHTLTPSRSLLFRFSALTNNAHLIHLDKAYCTDMEGHRSLLVHGPLSLVLMLEMLTRRLDEDHFEDSRGRTKPRRVVSEIEYRNLAPLYCDEPLTICGREKTESVEGVYELWVEGRDGGMSVKATARTAVVEPTVVSDAAQ